MTHEEMHAQNIPHEHEHTHADGATHSHPHDHAHEHPHGHDHTHGCPAQAHCDSDCANCSTDPRAEAIALMRYMVNHNTAHANELAQLAEKLRELGDNMACEQVMQAVSDFEKGNMRLSTVLSALDIPQ